MDRVEISHTMTVAIDPVDVEILELFLGSEEAKAAWQEIADQFIATAKATARSAGISMQELLESAREAESEAQR